MLDGISHVDRWIQRPAFKRLLCHWGQYLIIGFLSIQILADFLPFVNLALRVRYNDKAYKK